MLTLKTDCHILCSPCFFLKRLCLPMPSLSINCRSLLPLIKIQRFHPIQLLSMIFPCIPIIFIGHFMTLYVTFFFYYSNPGVHIFGCSLLLGPALKLWIDRKIYTVERLIQTCYDVCITVSGCLYYLGAHIKLALWRKVTDT